MEEVANHFSIDLNIYKFVLACMVSVLAYPTLPYI